MNREASLTVTRDRYESPKCESLYKKEKGGLETRLSWPTNLVLATAVTGAVAGAVAATRALNVTTAGAAAQAAE